MFPIRAAAQKGKASLDPGVRSMLERCPGPRPNRPLDKTGLGFGQGFITVRVRVMQHMVRARAGLGLGIGLVLALIVVIVIPLLRYKFDRTDRAVY